MLLGQISVFEMSDSLCFSVVTPVLNGRDFVSRYVSCLKSQVFRNWEALIVDDGSDDQTVELLHSLTHGDPRFRILFNPLVKQVNGPYQARNHALSLVRGDYICFLDIDDFWHPEWLASLSRHIEISSVKPLLLYSSYFRVDVTRRLAFKRHSSWPLSPKFLIRFMNIVPMLSSCVSAEFVTTLGLSFLPVNHEDYVFWKTVIDAVPVGRIFVDKKPMSFYNVSSNSLSGNKIIAYGWLLNCYSIFGYSFIQKIFALFLRIIFEMLAAICTALSGSASLNFELMSEEVAFSQD